MNKIQYIKLLELRGITELKGISIAQSVKESGGDPTLEEMVKVNEESMKFYITKLQEEEAKNQKLTKEMALMAVRLEAAGETEKWLRCLESAGLDNWDGIDLANEIMENEYK